MQQQEPAAAPPACSISSSSADYDSDSGIISPEAYARHAADWVREGATVVGGCCGVGPEHIAAVALAFKGGRGGTIGSSRNRLAGSSGEAD